MFEVIAAAFKFTIKLFAGLIRGIYTLVRDLVFYKAIKGEKEGEKKKDDLS